MDGFQRGFVLHTRPYSESSLLLDVFSEHEGRITLLAKGARRPRSAIKGALQPFTPLLLKWGGRSELRTLRSAEATGLGLPLSGNALYSGFYLNELVMRVLEPHIPYPALFLDYVTALTQLARYNNPEPALRCFELALLEALGYGVDFSYCAGSGAPINDNMTYLYRDQQGFVASIMKSQHRQFTGADLRALATRHFETVAQLRAAKRFTRMALKPYLGPKPLKSRELFRRK